MADIDLKQQDKDIKTLSTAELDQKVAKQGMKFEFADSKKAAKSILTLKRSDLPRGYKSKVAQGILNRIDSALSRTKDKIKVFNIKKAKALWEKFFDAFAEENLENEKKAAPEEEDKTKVKDLGAQGADTTLEESGYQIVRNDAGDSGVIVRLLKDNEFSIGYFKENPSELVAAKLKINGRELKNQVMTLHISEFIEEEVEPVEEPTTKQADRNPAQTQEKPKQKEQPKEKPKSAPAKPDKDGQDK
jgi:hypothetical protein